MGTKTGIWVHNSEYFSVKRLKMIRFRGKYAKMVLFLAKKSPGRALLPMQLHRSKKVIYDGGMPSELLELGVEVVDCR